MNKLKFSIVIPVYNSKRILEPGCAALQSAFKKTKQTFEILYWSDGSPDKPITLLRKLAKKHKNVRVFENRSNQGLGTTLRNLFNKSRGEFVIYMDADSYFTFDFSELPRLFKHLNKYDVIVGERYHGHKNDIPLRRRLASELSYFINRLFFRIKVRDTGSGLAFYRKTFLEKIKLTASGFEIHTELYARLQKAGAKAIEVSVKYQHWEGGSFNILKHGWKTIKEIVNVWSRLQQ